MGRPSKLSEAQSAWEFFAQACAPASEPQWIIVSVGLTPDETSFRAVHTNTYTFEWTDGPTE